MKDGVDSQENNPWIVEPKFARESTYWFPTLKMWDTTNIMLAKSFVQLSHLLLN